MSSPSTKKRKTTEAPALAPAEYSIASTSTSSSATVSEQTTNAPPPAAPMSALQARRAAQALQETLHPSLGVEDDGYSSDGSSVARALASSSDSEGDIEQAVTAAQAKLNKKRAKLAKLKGKGKQAGRYFAGEDGDGDGERVGAAAMDVDASQAQALARQPSAQGEEGQGKKMNRSKRRRMEKAAFTDPTCFSSFGPQLGVNAWKFPWGGFVFGLARDESLIVHGSYNLTPLSGAVSILSSILTAPSTPPSLAARPASSNAFTHAVFAPSSHPLPIVHALPLSQPPAAISLPDGQPIQGRDFDAVVLVYSLESGIEGVEKPLKAAAMSCASGMWESESSSGWGDKGWQLILEPTPSLTSLRMPDPWVGALEATVSTAAVLDQLMSGVSAPMGGDRFVALVEGPKRVGKSTFARLLLNRLLAQYEQVAYLDTDLGQPEFSPPGFVSLSLLSAPVLGPPFTHPTQPPFSHYLGALSPASDPAAYVAAVTALLASYALSVEFPALEGRTTTHKIRDRVPLVINTQGWVKGLGADLLSKLKQEAHPTHVYSFDAPIYEEQADGNASGEGRGHAPWQNEMGHQPLGAQMWQLPAAPSSPLDTKWTASDMRTLSLVSYFHADFPASLNATNEDFVVPRSVFPSKWNFNAPLVAQPPFNVDWRKEAGLVKTVHVLGGDVAYEQVLHALNGAVVALVASNSSGSADDNAPSHSTSFPYSPYSEPPPPSTSRSLGLALVRSISPATNSLQLLTPLAAATLAAHSPLSLVLGAVELPLPLMLDFNANEVEQVKGVAGVPWKDVPHLSIEEGERGAGRRRVRKNLMRRGQ